MGLNSFILWTVSFQDALVIKDPEHRSCKKEEEKKEPIS